MEKFSRNFTLLLESLRSENPIIEQDSSDEDSRGKKIKRVERKRKRLEGEEGKMFMSNDGEQFKLKPFLKILGILRDQIIGERVGVLNATRNDSIGSKYAKSVLQDLDLLFQKITSLMSYSKSIMDKENKELEIGSDSKEIESLTKQYQDLQEGYMKAAKDWKAAKEKELDERPIDQENQELEKMIQRASDLFDEAKTIFIRNTSNFIPASTDIKTDDKGKEGSKIEGDFKLKKSETKGKIDERIKKIQELYLELFKGTKVEETSIYKSAKKYGADGKWGPTTAKMIDQIKKGIKSLPDFKDKDLGGADEINQNLIAGLESLKKQKSGVKESEQNHSVLRTFESFMRERKGINEAEGLDTALDAMVSYEAPEKKASVKVEVKRKDTVDQLVKNKPEDKIALSEKDFEEAVNKAAEKKLDERDLKEVMKELKLKGVTIVDSDPTKGYEFNYNDYKNGKAIKKGYFAKCPGILFFAKGVCLSTYDGQIGWYDAEKGIIYFKGWKKGNKISDLIKRKGVPSKYVYLTNLFVKTINGESGTEKNWEKFNKMKFSTRLAILKASEWYWEKNDVDFVHQIKVQAKKNEEAKKFYTKNIKNFNVIN